MWFGTMMPDEDVDDDSASHDHLLETCGTDSRMVHNLKHVTITCSDGRKG